MTTVDYDVKVGISVIAAFSGSGKIKPLYFRAFEDGEELPVQVFVKNTGGNSIYAIFDCIYYQGDVEKPVQLIYFFRDHVWQLRTD